MFRRRWRLALAGLLALLAADATAADQPIRLAEDPALSPDGKRLAFSWNGDVWVANAKGGVARPLTSSEARDTSPVFSPDGSRIAFDSTRSGVRQVHVVPARGGTPEQWTFHSEGSSVRQWQGDTLLLYASRDHFWQRSGRFFTIDAKPRSPEELVFDAYGKEGHLSPDGSRVLFVREGVRGYRKGYRGSQAGQLWMFDRTSGKYTRLADHPGGSRTPVWHPSGKSFFYCSAKSGAFELWRHDLAEGREERLTEFDGDDSVLMPTISGDGKTVVFRRGFDLYRLNVAKADAAPQKVKLLYRGDDLVLSQRSRRLTSATEAAFTSDGLEVAFVAGGDVWVMDTVLREPRQVTSTPELESSPTFSPDNGEIWFVSDGGGKSDVWKAKRGDEDAYWWRNDSFVLTQVTDDSAVEADLKWSPDGERVAFVKSRGDLWTIEKDGKGAKLVVSSWSRPEFEFSPDGKWIVYSQSDNDFNRDVWIQPLDGSRERYNLSSHPDNDFSPVWSPDGKTIAFTGRRVGFETDIYYVQLQKTDDETGSRDRKLKEAIEKIKKVRKAPAKKPAAKAAPEAGKKEEPKKEEPEKVEPEKESDKPAAKAEEKPEEKKPEKKLPEVKIDFDGLNLRVRRVSISDATEGGLLWSPDSKKLAFSASINGKSGLYTISPPTSTTPKLLSTTVGSNARWLKTGNQIVWLAGGRPASLTATGTAASYGFTALQTVDTQKSNQVVFDLCWRAMRDNWYDERMNNRNWDQIRRKYAEVAREAVNPSMLSTVVNMMLGELNGSHLGFSSTVATGSGSGMDWRETTAHFGVRYDASFAGPGWKVEDVIRNSPATRQRSLLNVGDVVLSVDGTEVDPAMEVTAVLNGRLDRDVLLKVKNEKRDTRDVSIRPISYGAARSLLYEQWIDDSRQAVEKASQGRFGYVHIRGMNMSSFYRFERELYSVASGKAGLVIDVRENGGGSTTDHLLTILTQPTHAITQPRGGGPGYPHDRRVYATWSKPIVVLCNQNSFSNAEIFSHSVKTLERGQVVGVPTAGGVISTGGTRIAGVGFLRMPFRGWFLMDGSDMELNGCVPHHVVWPQPGDLPSGKDEQLAKAIEVLGKEVEEHENRPKVKLKYASELRKGP